MLYGTGRGGAIGAQKEREESALRLRAERARDRGASSIRGQKGRARIASICIASKEKGQGYGGFKDFGQIGEALRLEKTVTNKRWF